MLFSKNIYFWSQTDNNIRIIDHNNRIAYSMSDLGLGHFDNINRMVTISVIILSSSHCIKYDLKSCPVLPSPAQA